MFERLQLIPKDRNFKETDSHKAKSYSHINTHTGGKEGSILILGLKLLKLPPHPAYSSPPPPPLRKEDKTYQFHSRFMLAFGDLVYFPFKLKKKKKGSNNQKTPTRSQRPTGAKTRLQFPGI